jgi:hypothetical protein
MRANCSAAPTQLALCLRLASMYKAESWQRAVTLGNSTPQFRISEIRVWSYNPLLRSRHHRQVKLAVKINNDIDTHTLSKSHSLIKR